MEETIRGRVWTLGHDVDTDGIIGGKYLTIIDPNELKKHVFEIALPGVRGPCPARGHHRRGGELRLRIEP